MGKIIFRDNSRKKKTNLKQNLITKFKKWKKKILENNIASDIKNNTHHKNHFWGRNKLWTK